MGDSGRYWLFWDAVVSVQKAEKRTVGSVGAPEGRVVRKLPPMEETLFLLFFLAMVGFVIDWTLRLIGWK